MAAIQAAYEHLFPDPSEDLKTYWDFGRQRQWSCLTSDFAKFSNPQVMAFDRALAELDLHGSIEEIGALLRRLALTHNIGYSLGISPWTDDLLLRTVTAKTKRIVIVLGHDWYPIISGNRSYMARSPVDRSSVYDEPNYGAAIPLNFLADERTGVLFLNLFPDFRPPGADVIGSLGDYQPWLKGFDSVCRELVRLFDVVGVISWGSQVWEVLQHRADSELRSLGIMSVVGRLSERGGRMTLALGGAEISYYPFAHPSFSPNFRRPAHLVAYKAMCTSLLET